MASEDPEKIGQKIMKKIGKTCAFESKDLSARIMRELSCIIPSPSEQPEINRS